jgi:hypothetical protein
MKELDLRIKMLKVQNEFLMKELQKAYRLLRQYSFRLYKMKSETKKAA